MKNAYLILAHTNPEQIKLLIDNLDYLQSTAFFIHIDAKSKIEKKLRTYLGKRSNVFFVADRIKVCWGGVSIVEATLKLLRMAYEYHKKDTKVYFHLISGMDFPLKSNVHINDSLVEDYGVQYIEYNRLPYKGWSNNGGIDRIKYYWLMDDLEQKETYKLYVIQKELGMVNRNYSKTLPYYGGSQWWSITIDCARYVLYKTKNRRFIDMFKLTYCPDEFFFHTLIIRSGKFNIVNNNLRYIDWVSGPTYPKMLNMSDVNKIKLSDCLFARKINARNTPELVEYLINKIGDE